MSDFNRNYAAARPGYADRAAVDAGPRAYMIRVYNYMALALAVTGVAAWAAFNFAVTAGPTGALALTPFGQFLYSGVGVIAMVVVTLGLVFFISARISTLQPSTALALLMFFAGVLGLSLSSIFVTYTGTSITRVFFITAASFGALSLYGYTTQRDLSPIGSFLIMGVIGLLIASLVNIFLQSSGLQFIISAIGVLVFAGLTAYDTQRIKEMYDVMDDGTVAGRKAIMGALTLYLDFINLFQFLLAFLGDRR
jgi:FtsH-binding integral membrane protein